MPPTSGLDPLRASADPRNYVPIASSEQALDALRANLQAGCSRVALQGPSGIGKTLLLRVLAARELRRARSVIFSPFLHLPADDVARWLLHLLEKPACGTGAQDDQLLSEIAACGTDAMLVIVDEFQSTPSATAQRLAELALAARDGLVLVTGGRPGREMDGLRSVLLPDATVSLRAPLPAHEMRTLCDALLLQSGVELARRRDGADERDRVVDRARGIPGLLTPEILLCAKDDFVRAAIVAARCAGPLHPIIEIDAGRAFGIEDAPFESPPTLSELSALAKIVATSRRASVRVASCISTASQLVRAVAAHRPTPQRRFEQGARIASALRSRTVRRAEATIERARQTVRTLDRRLEQGARIASALRSRTVRRAEATVERARQAARTLSKSAAAALAAAVFYATSLGEETALRWRESRNRSANSSIPVAPPALVTALLLALVAWRLSGEVEDSIPLVAPVHAGSALIRVQVNARPWAVIRVDDVDVGPTPLSHLRLSPGPHEFEANFADGRSMRRRVEISSERRSVSLLP